MSSDPWSTPIDKFLAITLASGLLRLEQLREALRGFASEHASFDRNDVRAFCDYLVAHDMLTPWQGEKLQLGRWKGYFLDHYKLLAPDPERVNHYLAQDWHTREIVVLLLSCTEDDTVAYDLVEDTR